MIAEGNDFYGYQGETFDMVFDIIDENDAAYDLTGGVAVLTYWQGNDAAVKVSCVIATTAATASIAHATTQPMTGDYPYQFWCRNAAGKMVMTKEGIIHVKWSKDPDAVAPA